MSIPALTDKSQLNKIISEYNRYRRYTSEFKQEFVYTTFFEKLIRILGWDPWARNDYKPIKIDTSHGNYYGAQLFFDKGENIIVMSLEDSQILSPSELSDRNIDMSFTIRKIFIMIREKFADTDIKVIWFSSISKNYLYHYPDENPIYFFTAKADNFAKLHRNVFLKNFFPTIRFPSPAYAGVKLAIWIDKWERRLYKSLKNEQNVQNLLDFLITIIIFSRSGIKKTEKNLIENLLVKYHLSSKREFLLDVDFHHIIPKIFNNYRKNYNFNFYKELGCLDEIKNDLFALLLEEISCSSKIVFSIQSLGIAYHILQNKVFLEKLQDRKTSLNWIAHLPVLLKEVKIDKRTAQDMEKLNIYVDGNDIGLIIGTYEQLESIYEQLGIGVSNLSTKSEFVSVDLFNKKYSYSIDSKVTQNIPSKIIEDNLKIIGCRGDKKRAVRILFIKKAISFFSRHQIDEIAFPSKINFS